MSYSILLSVHPVFASSIMSGQKTAELRRRLKPENFAAGSFIFIYASKPVGRIIGRLQIVETEWQPLAKVLKPEMLADLQLSSVNAAAYLHGLDGGYVIRLDKPVMYHTPVLPHHILPVNKAGKPIVPQNYRILTGAETLFLNLRIIRQGE